MEEKRDLFASDRSFISAASALLILAGLLVLVGTATCQFAELEICSERLIPVFGGTDLFRPDLLTFNFPLAVLILGLSLRQGSRFGWITSLALLAMLTGSFASLSWFLYENADWLYWSRGAVMQQGLFFESIITDASFSLLFLGFLIYLLTPSVRQLYAS